ncbi:MAG: DUF2093 domain-containing protein [Oceanicaulis sp.]
MNAFDRDFTGEATLEYGDADYLILKPGSYVTCAVTGAKIPIPKLKYWSAEHQEAYVDAYAATRRWLALNGGPAGAPEPGEDRA